MGPLSFPTNMTQLLSGFLTNMTPRGREGFLMIMTHPRWRGGMVPRPRPAIVRPSKGGPAMAYRELGMWEVLDVLRRVHRRETKSGIERATGRTRKTIQRYVKTAAKLGWAPGGGEPDEALGGAGVAAASSWARAAGAGRSHGGGAGRTPRAAARVARARRRHAGASALEGEDAARAPGRSGALQLAAPLRCRTVRLPRCAAPDRTLCRVRAGGAGRGGLRPPRSRLGSRDAKAARGPRAAGDVYSRHQYMHVSPLERPRFDPPVWASCKVHGDHHVQFRKALYSVPTRHVGKTVWVRGDTKLVRIFVDGVCVKTHEPVAEGKRSTDYKDYPAELAPYAMRDPEALIREAERVGESASFMPPLRFIAGE